MVPFSIPPSFPFQSLKFFLTDSLCFGFFQIFYFFQYSFCEFTPSHACCWVCLIWDWIARISLFFVSFFFLLPRKRRERERGGLSGPGSFGGSSKKKKKCKGKEGEIFLAWPVGSFQLGAHGTRFFALRS